MSVTRVQRVRDDDEDVDHDGSDTASPRDAKRAAVDAFEVAEDVDTAVSRAQPLVTVRLQDAIVTVRLAMHCCCRVECYLTRGTVWGERADRHSLSRFRVSTSRLAATLDTFRHRYVKFLLLLCARCSLRLPQQPQQLTC